MSVELVHVFTRLPHSSICKKHMLQSQYRERARHSEYLKYKDTPPDT